MRAVETTIQRLIGSGMDPQLENNPYLCFVYTSFQVRTSVSAFLVSSFLCLCLSFSCLKTNSMALTAISSTWVLFYFSVSVSALNASSGRPPIAAITTFNCQSCSFGLDRALSISSISSPAALAWAATPVTAIGPPSSHRQRA